MNNPASRSSSDWPEKLATAPQGDSAAADQHCLEIFRRALQQSNQPAREDFQRRLSAVVLSWIRHHPRNEEALRHQNEEHYMKQAFARFWQLAVPREEELSSFAAILKCLQASLNAVMLDTLRVYSRSKEASMAQLPSPEKPRALSHEDNQEVWENIYGLLVGQREQRVAYLLFHCGLTPKEIAQSYPQECGEATEIAHLRRTLLEKVAFQGSSSPAS